MKVQVQRIGIPRVHSGLNSRVEASMLKTPLRRVFDEQSPCILMYGSSSSSPSSNGFKGGVVAEQSLAKMVRSFVEEGNEKSFKYGGNNCNCFNGYGNENSDDEFNDFDNSREAIDLLKGLVNCMGVHETKLQSEIMKIVGKSKNMTPKDELRKLVTENLVSLGYSASLCKSKWSKSSDCPAGEYEYIDVIIEDERMLIDLDFRSQFEIARSTSNYKALLQSLPLIFVGKSYRLSQIVTILSHAAHQSLRKKGLHIPPWRKTEYMKAKWLSEKLTRAAQSDSVLARTKQIELDSERMPWQPPVVKPRGVERGAKKVAGLTCLFQA